MKVGHIMKYANALYEVRQWNDEEHEDYDYYTLGVQIETLGLNNHDDWKFVMDGVIDDYLKDTEFGAEYAFCEFCDEYVFDIVGCDVL